MRIKLDENIPLAVGAYLAGQGCDVQTVLSEALSGAADPEVVEAARREKRILMTLDKGIANVRAPEMAGHFGLILLRLKHPSVKAILALVKKQFPALMGLALEGRIVAISSGGIRVR